jgi:hypothetical protein
LAPDGALIAAMHAPDEVTAAGQTFGPADRGSLLLLLLSAAGQVVAGIRAGGEATVVNDVARDRAGNVYVTGSFRGSAWFDCTELTSLDQAAFVWKAGKIL